MRLVRLDAGTVRALAAGSPVRVDGLLLDWPDEDRRVLRYRCEALDADPASAPYLLHVLLDDSAPGGPRLAGRIGCHEGPRDGVLEIGYRVAPAYRGRGVATAMVGEFLAWLAPRGVRRVRAAVSPDNAASLGVLAHFGFAEVGDQWDDEDGPELLLEAVLPTGR
jgi:RimJ/RimL family protein N-acetyltransferase